MAGTSVLTGSRAVVKVDGTVVGIFDSCNWGANIGVEDIHLLGRYSTAEITQTSYSAVSVSCTGFRVVGQGVHVLGKFPKVQDLMDMQNFTIEVYDRQTGKNVANIIKCVPTSYNSGVNARATSKVTINYMGTILSDESGAQDEGVGATSLPETQG